MTEIANQQLTPAQKALRRAREIRRQLDQERGIVEVDPQLMLETHLVLEDQPTGVRVPLCIPMRGKRVSLRTVDCLYNDGCDDVVEFLIEDSCMGTEDAVAIVEDATRRLRSDVAIVCASKNTQEKATEIELFRRAIDFQIGLHNAAEQLAAIRGHDEPDQLMQVINEFIANERPGADVSAAEIIAILDNLENKTNPAMKVAQP